MRLSALRYVFDNRLRAGVEGGALRSSLVLGAVGIWMLNALNFRPEGAQQYKSLADACCQHAGSNESDQDSDDSDAEDTVPVGYNRGIFFLGDIMEDRVHESWRVPLAMSTRVDELHLAGIYGRTSMAILEHDAGIDRVLAPKGTITHTSRIPNKRRRTTAVQFVRDADIEEDIIDLQLAHRGITLRPVGQETGHDVDEARFDQEEDEIGDVTPDDAVSRIWKQVPFDIFAVSPNGVRMKDPSHIIMSNQARHNVTWETFKSTDFSGIFEKIQIRMVPSDSWTTTMFDRYFPPKGTAPKERGKLQNFPYTTYYNDWFKLMSQLSVNDAKVVRAGVLREFKKLKWLPHGGSDRMWATSKMSGKNWTMHPIGSKHVACPQIAVNSSTWNREPIIMGVRAVAMAEEYEEEEEEEEE